MSRQNDNNNNDVAELIEYNPQQPFASTQGLTAEFEQASEGGPPTQSSPARSDRQVHSAHGSQAGSASTSVPPVDQLQPPINRGSAIPTTRVLGSQPGTIHGSVSGARGHTTASTRASVVPRGDEVTLRATAQPGGRAPSSAIPPQEEVFDRVTAARRAVTQYRPIGRFARKATTFASDLSVGKFGVLGEAEADAVESRLFSMLAHDDFSIAGKSELFRDEFLRTLWLFLAINSGSIGNTVGRMGVRDDSQPLCFQDAQISAADVAAVLGDRAYAYMRARATEIRDTIEMAFATAASPNAEREFPGVCKAADLIRVVAAAKGLGQYPQYAAVGSEYAVGTPPYMIALIKESSAKVLSNTQGNVRESSVAGSSNAPGY